MCVDMCAWERETSATGPISHQCVGAGSGKQQIQTPPRKVDDDNDADDDCKLSAARSASLSIASDESSTANARLHTLSTIATTTASFIDLQIWYGRTADLVWTHNYKRSKTTIIVQHGYLYHSHEHYSS